MDEVYFGYKLPKIFSMSVLNAFFYVWLFIHNTDDFKDL